LPNEIEPFGRDPKLGRSSKLDRYVLLQIAGCQQSCPTSGSQLVKEWLPFGHGRENHQGEKSIVKFIRVSDEGPNLR
jgi:hypothetical protein